MLNMVTVTGADDSVQPSDLFAVARLFPFVEFGILGGAALARVDVVNRLQGLGTFSDEIDGALEVQIDNFVVRILPIERIIASKKVANRPKDRAALPALRAALAAIKFRGKSRP